MSDQEKLAFLASGHLLSLTQAAALTPYSAEYLSLLARRGKLKAVKVTRDWLTTSETVLDYVQKQQIRHEQSLNELKEVEGRLQ